MLKKFLRKKITRPRLDAFLSKHSTNKLTLDLGCGGSPYMKYFKNRVGFDIAERKNVDIVGDVHNLPFENEKFDIILCTEVLEHSHSPHIAIKEMKRVLKPGGSLILTTRFIFPIHDAPYDFYRYTKYGLWHLFRDWEILELEEETNTIETLAVLLQGIAFQTELHGGKITKFFLFSLAKIILKLSFLTKEEFGDRRLKNTVIEKSILTSGYYLVCKKK